MSAVGNNTTKLHGVMKCHACRHFHHFTQLQIHLMMFQPLTMRQFNEYQMPWAVITWRTSKYLTTRWPTCLDRTCRVSSRLMRSSNSTIVYLKNVVSIECPPLYHLALHCARTLSSSLMSFSNFLLVLHCCPLSCLQTQLRTQFNDFKRCFFLILFKFFICKHYLALLSIYSSSKLKLQVLHFVDQSLFLMLYLFFSFPHPTPSLSLSISLSLSYSPWLDIPTLVK